MLRVRPIHFTSRMEEWERLLTDLGMVKTIDDGSWREFDAGSGRLALHQADAGSPEDGTTEFGVEVGDLAEFARRTVADGTLAEVLEAPHGSTVRVTMRDGFAFCADKALHDVNCADANGALAVVGTWITPDVQGACRELRNIGARPRRSAPVLAAPSGWADFSTKNGGILVARTGRVPSSGTIAFEYDGGLPALLEKLAGAGVGARLESSPDGKTLFLRNPDANDDPGRAGDMTITVRLCS